MRENIIKSRHWPVGLLVLTAGLNGVAAPAFAAEANGNTPEADGEIVVTALRRNESLQNAPAAITALSSTTLARLGAKDFYDYYRSVPSLQITPNALAPGQARISLRSVFAAGDATVGLYYGETPVTGPSGNSADASQNNPNLNLFDVERVEVLRGPQGTLYGAGSVGGTMRILFKKPDPTRIGGQIEAQGSTTEHGGEGGYLRGVINLPLITDQLAMRVVAYTERTAGYVDNVRLGLKDTNEATTSGGRAILAWTPSPDFDLTATAIYQKTHADNNSTWYQSLGRKSYNTDTPIQAAYNDRFRLFSATANWDLQFAKLTATASDYRWNTIREGDATVLFYGPVVNTQASSPLCRVYNSTSQPCSPAQLANYINYGLSALPAKFVTPLLMNAESYEARLTSPGGGWFDWTVGVFYEKRADVATSKLTHTDPLTGKATDPVMLFGVAKTRNEYSQFSQFGEISVHPTPDLTFTGGTRHYHYDKEVAGQVLESGFIFGSFAGPRTTAKSSKSGWVSKVAASYKFDEGILGYAQWAQGFRAGGANNVPGLSDALVAYQPDTLESYEAGLKTSWFGGRLTANIAAYQINWSDIQSQLIIQPSFRLNINAGNARIRGIEVEATARPLSGLAITTTFSYTPTANLISGQTGGTIIVGPQNGLAGDRLPYSPKFSGTVSADYSWSLTEQFDAFVRADINYHGKSASEFRPTFVNYEILSAFAEVNAKVGVEAGDWGAHLFVNNVMGIVGPLVVQSLTVTPPYQAERQLGSLRPRTFGLNVSKKF